MQHSFSVNSLILASATHFKSLFQFGSVEKPNSNELKPEKVIFAEELLLKRKGTAQTPG